MLIVCMTKLKEYFIFCDRTTANKTSRRRKQPANINILLVVRGRKFRQLFACKLVNSNMQNFKFVFCQRLFQNKQILATN